jgi:hypothetical protein
VIAVNACGSDTTPGQCAQAAAPGYSVVKNLTRLNTAAPKISAQERIFECENDWNEPSASSAIVSRRRPAGSGDGLFTQNGCDGRSRSGNVTDDVIAKYIADYQSAAGCQPVTNLPLF